MALDASSLGAGFMGMGPQDMPATAPKMPSAKPLKKFGAKPLKTADTKTPKGPKGPKK